MATHLDGRSVFSPNISTKLLSQSFGFTSVNWSKLSWIWKEKEFVRLNHKCLSVGVNEFRPSNLVAQRSPTYSRGANCVWLHNQSSLGWRALCCWWSLQRVQWTLRRTLSRHRQLQGDYNSITAICLCCDEQGDKLTWRRPGNKLINRFEAFILDILIRVEV